MNSVHQSTIKACNKLALGATDQDRRNLSRFLSFQRIFCLVWFPQVDAKADIGWNKKMNGHLMASFVGNIYTKNYENLIIFV